MNKLHAAFILAAGLGERLRPVTDSIPKPLVPLCGKPGIERAVERVLQCGPEHLCINLHYKADAIRAWAAGTSFGSRIRFFEELAILGTGGALKNAAPLLSGGTFFVHNADIVSDADLSVILARHRSEGNLVTLAVHDCPRFNTVRVASDGSFAGLYQAEADQPEARLLAFTGIAVYEPAFLDYIPEGVSHVTDAWQRALDDGHRVAAVDVSGCSWSDIGTPEAYMKAVFDILRADGETVFFHSSTAGCDKSMYQGYVSVEKDCRLEGAALKNCVVLPGCDVSHQLIENALVHAGGILPLAESALFNASGDGVVEIGAGGSDRRYFRIGHESGSAILLQCIRRDEEFERQAEYTKFFTRQGIRVPRLRSIAPDHPAMLFEDLGDLSLYSWLKCPRSVNAVESMYRKVLDQLVQLHSAASLNVHECPLLAGRVFDYDYLRWETEYFIERFVIGLLGVDVDDRESLNGEFHQLASEVDAAPRAIIHRDCQSQNIMLKDGIEACLIDYQGARLLTPAYDVASLLWDPYCRLGDDLRDRLVGYYLDGMKRSSPAFSEAAFLYILLPCRLQRHMQALGAYGFLSKVKGKKSFLKHVTEGLRLLKRDVEEERDNYPELAALVFRLQYSAEQ